MSTQKKFIVYLSILLVLSTILAGCAFSTKSSQSNSSDSSDSSNYTVDTSNLNETLDEITEPLLTDTAAPAATETTAATTGTTKASSTTKPSTAKPTTTKPATTVPTTSTAPVSSSSIVLDNLMGLSAAAITQKFGIPVATEKSEYGFYWHVYHRNYANFFMIGIQNNKVVGLYSNSAGLSFAGIKSGTAKTGVRAAMSGYTGPMATIKKSQGEYGFQATIMAQRDVFTDNQKYVTMFYDNINGGTLTAVEIIDYPTIQSFGKYPPLDKNFTEDYEMVSFYLINSTRVRFGKLNLQYDKDMAKVAAGHSQDMINGSFFDHKNPYTNKYAGDRITEAGFSFLVCAENISMNHLDEISAHEEYMNSSGHRKNILDSDNRGFTFVGVGVRFTSNAIRQTMVFITYP